jgi:hypothetical protein
MNSINDRRRTIRQWARCTAVCLTVLIVLPLSAQPATPIMPLDEVRVGMRGYGLTVFHGAEVEPFNCHVVSVISDSSAQRATIWIECTDERMQRSGPVQGMSGSPIFLWDEGEEGTIGEGGRLIGAFAFGFSNVNVCLVGVQPIEYMRQVGERALEEPATPEARRAVPPGAMSRSLSILRRVADSEQLPAGTRLPLDAVRRLLSDVEPLPPADGSRWGGTSSGPSVTTPHGDTLLPLKLPLAVGDAQTARLLGPLLEPAGIRVLAGDNVMVAGQPPSNVDPDHVRLEPGAVLSIPLAYGDVDLNAAGTVTDVLPDGTVLGFGHAMNSVGSSRLPMASGYTHYVVSRNTLSFKRGASLDIVGSIVRDEAAAVAGTDDLSFFAAPVSVEVQMVGQPTRNYSYHVVDEPQLTPAILAAVVNASLTAVQGPPLLHTMQLEGEVVFSGDRTLRFDRTLPGTGMNGVAFEMLPPLSAMMLNPFEPLRLESADLKLVVEPGIQQSALVAATLDRAVVQPGQTVQVTLELEPFDGPPHRMSVPFTVPSDFPAGEYQLQVSDFSRHTMRRLSTDPQLSRILNIDQLTTALQAIAAIDEESVYVALPRPVPSLSVGRIGLESLPSSRAAVIASSSSSSATPYPVFVESQYPTPEVVAGEVSLPIRIEPNTR